jgi:hypothetical protein
MATSAQESAVRTYLTALHDPSTLRDDQQVGALQQRLESAQDAVERIKIRQELHELQTPSIDRFEDAFVTHAKAWAESHGIDADAFAAEGVAPAVLRRAGFRVGRGGATGNRSGGAKRTRTRVTTEEVRNAVPPKGTFTIKALQERSGASPAVVRKVVADLLAEGRLSDEGVDERHGGPGRAPRLYKRTK